MKHLISLAALLLILGLAASSDAQAGNEYGSGVMPDSDGDGIPNGCDPDYVPPLDGTGCQYGSPEDLVGIFLGNLYPPYLMKGNCWINVNSWQHSYGDTDGTGNDLPPSDPSGLGPWAALNH